MGWMLTGRLILDSGLVPARNHPLVDLVEFNSTKCVRRFAGREPSRSGGLTTQELGSAQRGNMS